MPDYGSVQYWNKRYREDSDSPFDWLFSFEDLKDILEHLLPDKNEEILLVGSGNAPFSPDMCRIGQYKKLLNTDLSDVVIKQQSSLFPDQHWEVMDVMKMRFADGSIKCVVDKSLIDTLVCYENSQINTLKMVDEIYRVLAPGSRFITFSLHSINEVKSHYSVPSRYNWNVSYFNIKSSRWEPIIEKMDRSVAHTMIVCDKPNTDGTYYNDTKYPLQVPGTLHENEYKELKRYAKEVIFNHAVQSNPFITTNDILTCLENALITYDNSLVDKYLEGEVGEEMLCGEDYIVEVSENIVLGVEKSDTIVKRSEVEVNERSSVEERRESMDSCTVEVGSVTDVEVDHPDEVEVDPDCESDEDTVVTTPTNHQRNTTNKVNTFTEKRFNFKDEVGSGSVTSDTV